MSNPGSPVCNTGRDPSDEEGGTTERFARRPTSQPLQPIPLRAQSSVSDGAIRVQASLKQGCRKPPITFWRPIYICCFKAALLRYIAVRQSRILRSGFVLR